MVKEGMTFEEWKKTELLDDEYFHMNDMYWYAELAWKAAIKTIENYEKICQCPVVDLAKTRSCCSVCGGLLSSSAT